LLLDYEAIANFPHRIQTSCKVSRRCVVATILNYIPSPAAFDPEVISIMAKAYEQALASLESSPPQSVRELIAARIIGLARGGERDPRTLCAKALAALGIVRDGQQDKAQSAEPSPQTDAVVSRRPDERSSL
jgi:hypothetical protein